MGGLFRSVVREESYTNKKNETIGSEHFSVGSGPDALKCRWFPQSQVACRALAARFRRGGRLSLDAVAGRPLVSATAGSKTSG